MVSILICRPTYIKVGLQLLGFLTPSHLQSTMSKWEEILYLLRNAWSACHLKQHIGRKEMKATPLHSSSTLNSYQATMSCMGNPIRKCVHQSIPHSNFYLLGNSAKILNCKLQKKCYWFSKHVKSAEFLCKEWQILYVFILRWYVT